MAGPDEGYTFSLEEADSYGAEGTEVLGSAYTSVRDYARDQERVISDLTQRWGNPKLRGDDSRGPYRFSGAPLIISTENLAFQGRYILFWSGPSNTSWSFPTRSSVQQTKSGTITHYWRDAYRQSFFDEPSVSFTFQAGNIMPVRVMDTSQGQSAGTVTTSLPFGLMDFYDFFDILNQPKILSDGRPNFVYIAYHSLVYPEIFLRGFFEPDGISFSEDAGNPASLTWTAKFKIRSTEPPFWSPAQLAAAWQSAFVPPPNIIETASTAAGESPVTGQGDLG